MFPKVGLNRSFSNKVNLPKQKIVPCLKRGFGFSFLDWMHPSKIRILVLQGKLFLRCAGLPSSTYHQDLMIKPCHSFGASAQSSHTSRSGLAFQESRSRLSAFWQNIFCTLCLLLVQMGCKFHCYVPGPCRRYESHARRTNTHSKFHYMIIRLRNTER